MINHSTWRILGLLALLVLILGACNPFAPPAPAVAPSPLPLPSSTVPPPTDTPAPTDVPTRNPALSTTPQPPPSPFMFWSDSAGVISVLQLDTGKTMTLLDPANRVGGRLDEDCWGLSPDGQQILYFSSRLEGNHQVEHVNVVDLVSNQTTQLPYNLPRCQDFAWHPDGKTILVRNGSSFELYSLPDRTNRFSIQLPGSSPVFSADGKRVALVNTSGREINWYNVTLKNQQAIAISQRKHSLTLSSLPDKPLLDRLVFSPDGSRLVFWAPDLASDQLNDLYVVALGDGSTDSTEGSPDKWIDAMQLSPGEIFNPRTAVWSPDGARLAVWGDLVEQLGASGFTAKDTLLFVVDLKDQKVFRVSDNGYPHPFSPLWSADSSLLYYISGRNLVQCQPDGSGKRAIPLKVQPIKIAFNPQSTLAWTFQPGSGRVKAANPTATVVKVAIATPMATSSACAAGWTRLKTGGSAVVLADPVRARSEPAKSGSLLTWLQPGTRLKVMQGPVCADGLVFWRVESSAIPGGSAWAAEGDGKDYYLKPG